MPDNRCYYTTVLVFSPPPLKLGFKLKSVDNAIAYYKRISKMT